MKHILFMTPNNLPTNPRLLKEVDLAIECGYHTSVVMFGLKGWSLPLNIMSMHDHPDTDFIVVKTGRSNLLWMVATVFHIISKFLCRCMNSTYFLSSVASEKRSLIMLFQYSKIKRLKPDLIIAHNMGALYPAWLISGRLGIPFAFDMEDYYPGEAVHSDQDRERDRREKLMVAAIKECSYVSYASDEIRQMTGTLPVFQNDHHFTIFNCFPSVDFPFLKSNAEKTIHLVWFSQDISYNRGLELIIPFLPKFKSGLILTLIGNIDDRFYKEYISGNEDFIRVVLPKKIEKLHKYLTEFDIGLALEPGKDLNNRIALSNKVFSYVQAGLFVLATNSIAQQNFVSSNPLFGSLCEPNEENLKKGLSEITAQIKKIRSDKLSRYTAAKRFSWEEINHRLTESWHTILQ